MARRAAAAALWIAPEFEAALASAGVLTVAQVLDASECVRDLRDRSNHVLRIGTSVFHVKRRRNVAKSAEAETLRRAQAAGVPTPAIAFEGADPASGAIVGTVDLAPARPLDELLREGAIPASSRARLIADLALAVARLHDARLHPRDLYLNHVFAFPFGARAGVTLIDLERASGRRWFRRRAVVRDLAALRASTPDERVSAGERRRFLVLYLRARGVDLRGRFASLSRAVERKAASIRAHVPRTPVGDAARPPSSRP